MQVKQVLFITLVLVVLFGAFSVDAAALEVFAAAQPWTKQVLVQQETGILNLSTAFVGADQIPMLSYTRTGYHPIYTAFKETEALAGNCGPGLTWVCLSWLDSALIPGTLSNLSTNLLEATHLEKWAYLTSAGTIRGWTIERNDEMIIIDNASEPLLQIDKFGTTLVGAPSVQTSIRNFRMAVTIRDDGTDLFQHKLVYVRWSDGINTTCLDSGSPYLCEVIDISFGNGSMGAPTLGIADDATVGIAYYKSGSVMYAYPHTPTMFVPSNCGANGQTWRCIAVFTQSDIGLVGPVVKLAMGQDISQRGIAFTYDTLITPDTLYHAGYVGSGGNCGTDRNSAGMNVEKWYCDDIVNFHWLNPDQTPSFSIDLDPFGYSTIAYDYADSNLGNKDLYVAYPDDRIGFQNWWTRQKIDGATVENVSTGGLAAIAMSSSGLGFVAYLQKMEAAGEAPNLKAAWQQFQAYLPVIRR